MKLNSDSILAFLAVHAEMHPEKKVYTLLKNGLEVDKEVTYRQLLTTTMSISAMLKAKRLFNKPVLLVYKCEIEFIVAFLACLHVGAIPIPTASSKALDISDYLINILNDSKATEIVCQEDLLDDLNAIRRDIRVNSPICVIPTNFSKYSSAAMTAPELNQSIAFIQYTSGSTKSPKGVKISHENLVYNLEFIKNAFMCDSNSIIFSWLPFHHDMGLIGNLLQTIFVGCSAVLMKPSTFIQSPKLWLSGIEIFKATHSGGPDFAYKLCVEKIPEAEVKKMNLSSWQVAFNGAEPIHYETIVNFASHYKSAKFNPNAICPCYGLAEATLFVSGKKKNKVRSPIFVSKSSIGTGKVEIADHNNIPGCYLLSSGEVVEELSLKIIKPDKTECGELEEGEIILHGKSVTSGYWNRNDSEIFENVDGKNYLKTGDIGFLYKKELFVHGRIKEMLIIRGINFYPYDLEKELINQVKCIQTNGVAVFSINNFGNEVVVAAEIRRTALAKLDSQEVIDKISRVINGLCGVIPVDIILTGPFGIPRTTSGKIQRIKCREKYERNSFNIIESKSRMEINNIGVISTEQLLQQVVKLRDKESITQYLLSLISHKIKIDNLGDRNVKINFPELGLDSLKSLELINRINSDLVINMQTTKIYKGNTFYELVGDIHHLLWLKNVVASEREIEI